MHRKPQEEEARPIQELAAVLVQLSRSDGESTAVLKTADGVIVDIRLVSTGMLESYMLPDATSVPPTLP